MMLQERWMQLAPEAQLGHIGSEIARARSAYDRGDTPMRQGAIERALDLIRLSIDDPRQSPRLKELCRLKELVADWYFDTRQHKVPLEELERHCTGIYMDFIQQEEPELTTTGVATPAEPVAVRP